MMQLNRTLRPKWRDLNQRARQLLRSLAELDADRPGVKFPLADILEHAEKLTRSEAQLLKPIAEEVVAANGPPKADAFDARVLRQLYRQGLIKGVAGQYAVTANGRQMAVMLPRR